jgi:hypothetical protein
MIQIPPNQSDKKFLQKQNFGAMENIRIKKIKQMFFKDFVGILFFFKWQRCRDSLKSINHWPVWQRKFVLSWHVGASS